MSWSTAADSAVFRTFIKAALGSAQTADVLPAAWGGLAADTLNVALYGNSGTPTKDDTLAHSGYNATGSPWVTANQVTDTNWAAAGRPLASKAFSTPSSGVVMFDAADTASNGTVTLANVYGCLVYDDTITAGTGGIADEAVSYHYFGGAQSVTGGTFTVVWNANGLFRVTV
jgi:hypothetical protein